MPYWNGDIMNENDIELPDFLDRREMEDRRLPVMSKRGRPKKGVVPFDEYSLIADRYRLGDGLKEIARDNGVTQREIRRILVEQGVEIRRRGRSSHS